MPTLVPNALSCMLLQSACLPDERHAITLRLRTPMSMIPMGALAISHAANSTVPAIWATSTTVRAQRPPRAPRALHEAPGAPHYMIGPREVAILIKGDDDARCGICTKEEEDVRLQYSKALRGDRAKSQSLNIFMYVYAVGCEHRSRTGHSCPNAISREIPRYI